MTLWICRFDRESYDVSGELENGWEFGELQKAGGASVGKVELCRQGIWSMKLQFLSLLPLAAVGSASWSKNINYRYNNTNILFMQGANGKTGLHLSTTQLLVSQFTRWSRGTTQPAAMPPPA
jgi:hypothetical protein